MVRPMATGDDEVARRRAARNSCGVVDAGASAARRRSRVPPTMKAALSTLTAAITRARRSAPAQACTAAKAGTMNRPPAIARPARSIAMRMPRPAPKNAATAGTARRPARRRQVDKPRSSANRPSSDGADQGRQQDDAAGCEPGGEARADRDGDGEDREIGGDHLLVAAEHVLHQRRHQRQHDRADEPEPARHQRRPTTAAGRSRRCLSRRDRSSARMFGSTHEVGRAPARCAG